VTGVAILGAVVVVVLVASINDYQKEKQFRKCPSNKQNKPFLMFLTVVIYVVIYIIGIFNR
jgi:phosphotransferase system  glucose/maltose/N-acetylglucosamine-specific IIC component